MGRLFSCSSTVLFLISAVSARSHDAVRQFQQPRPGRVLEEGREDSRQLELGARDPTGFMVRYHGCTTTENVIVKACLNYRDGFGGSCDTYFVARDEWETFFYNSVVLRMLYDFCQVCEELCPPEVMTTATEEELEKLPDICASVYYLSPVESTCVTLCQDKHPQENHFLEHCEEAHSYNPCTGHTSRLLASESSIRRTSTDTSTCILREWWDDWVASYDAREVGYISDWDELSRRPIDASNAWLQCSFDQGGNDNDKDDIETARLCHAFYYQQITPCRMQENQIWHAYFPHGSLPTILCDFVGPFDGETAQPLPRRIKLFGFGLIFLAGLIIGTVQRRCLWKRRNNSFQSSTRFTTSHQLENETTVELPVLSF